MIVHLYGVYSPERQDYANYLSWVAQQIKLAEVDTVILCGGFTVPNLPQISEASSAKEYLSQKINNVTWLLEDGSFTTYQNTYNAAKIIIQNNLNPSSIYVLADHSRQAKVIWLALTLLLEQAKIEAYRNLASRSSQANYDGPFSCDKLTLLTFNYQSKLSDEAIRQTYSALIDALPVYDKALDAIATQNRRRDFGFES